MSMTYQLAWLWWQWHGDADVHTVAAKGTACRSISRDCPTSAKTAAYFQVVVLRPQTTIFIFYRTAVRKWSTWRK